MSLDAERLPVRQRLSDKVVSPDHITFASSVNRVFNRVGNMDRKSFVYCDKRILRWYFLAACRHIDRSLTDDAREVLAAAEKHLWGEVDDDTAKTAEATIMAKILGSMGIRADLEQNRFSHEELEFVMQVTGPDQLKLNAGLTALKTFIPDVYQPGSRLATASHLANFEHAAASQMPVMEKLPSRIWCEVMDSERDWLQQLQKHVHPQLAKRYPGVPSEDIVSLTMSLSRGNDCAWALCDALEEGPHAGDRSFVKPAIKHFKKQSYHPRGCKYVEAILSPRGTSYMGDQIASLSEPGSVLLALSGLNPEVDGAYAGWFVTIIGGKGEGQSRMVDGQFNYGRSIALELNQDWYESPDSTSLFTVTPPDGTNRFRQGHLVPLPPVPELVKSLPLLLVSSEHTNTAPIPPSDGDHHDTEDDNNEE